MRKSLTISLASLVIACVLGPSLASAISTEKTNRINMARVTIREDSLETNSTIATFVPTGSANTKCLVTLMESSFATYGQTVYCGIRLVNDKYGALIHIFLPTNFNLPDEFVFKVAVFQQGATKYGAPMPCPTLPGDPCGPAA